MSGWRAAVVASIVGGLILLGGYLVPRLGGDDDGTSTTDEDISGLTLACAPALETACDEVAQALDVSSTTWNPGQALPSRYVLLAPSEDLADDMTAGPAIVQSPIVIGAWLDRSSILLARCGSVDIDCLGTVLGRQWEDLGGNDVWGDVKIGLADPARSEAGMLAWSLIQPASTRIALTQSLRLVADNDARLTTDLVLFGDSRADVVVTTEVAVASQFQNAIGRGGRLEIFYPTSSPWVEYVAVAEGFGSGRLVERLQQVEIGQIFATAGLRPTTGSFTFPEPMGTPGTRSAAPDAATRGTLLTAWEQTR